MKFLFLCFLSLLLIQINAAEKPNILWITLEDTSPQFVGCYGNKHVHTPTIDKLASEGIMFTNAFSTATVCAPSRFTIITGCNTEHMGTGNHRSNIKIPEYIKGFPNYLKEAGYYTSNNAKTDYNTANAKRIINDAWHESSKKAGWTKRNVNQPFFSVFNYNTCHQSRTMTNPYAWYNEFVLKKLPKDLHTYGEEIEVPAFLNDTPEMRKHLVRVHNSINLTDYEIKLLLDSLKHQGLKDETIIFCFADHGEAIPRGKTNSIGLGYRVPFIIWFPEKYKHLSPWQIGKACDELICFEDLAPTILNLANLDIPDYMQGRSFLGKKREEPIRYLYGSRNRIDETPGLARSVTNGEYLYTRVYLPQYPQLRFQKYAEVSDIVKTIRNDNANKKLNQQQSEILQPRKTEYLYNLKSDKWEMNNLIEDEKYGELARQMHLAVKDKILATSDVHFLPEYEINQINKGGTVSDFCSDSLNYPITEILDVAELVGSGSSVINQQLELLKSHNSIIRYWAAVGLKVQVKIPNEKLALIENHLTDNYPPVQIEIASILYKNTFSDSAKNILKEMTLHENPYLALQALQNIQNMEVEENAFNDTFHQIIEKYGELKNRGNEIYHILSIAEVYLYNAENRPLYYKHMKKWIKQ